MPDDEEVQEEGHGEPSTVTRPTYQGSPAGPPSFVVSVIAGPDVGRSYVCDNTQPSRVLVGSSPVCALRLTDLEVSRRHLALEAEGSHLRLLDVGSTNGTFVEHIRVVEALLKGGESVRIGSTELRIERAPSSAPAALPSRSSFGRILGASAEMRRMYGLCEMLAASTIPVVIEGETGSGKEGLAEALHEEGPRRAEPFVVFDCTAVPPSLLDSELFGHERGSFTGAITSRAGVFEQAHGGTLLIDEIGDLDLSLQPKLLRAVERREVRRVGGNKTIPVDVRLIAATRRNLDEAVQRGTFRDDLFHRLAVSRIELPPLRRRKGDVTLLARHFCMQQGGNPDSIPTGVLRRWEEYSWPGNVRELRNAVVRQLALGEWAESLSEEDSAAPPTAGDDVISSVLQSRGPLAQARQRVVEELERRYLNHVLTEHGGNIGRAAAASGMGRRHFQKLRAKSR